MAVKYNPQVKDLLERLDALEEIYRDGYADSPDIKMLQGVERCLELRMKILGFDGKNPVTSAAPDEQDNKVSIDLKELSEQTLREILSITNKKNRIRKGVKETF